MLQRLGGYVDESFSVCLRFEAKEREAEEVWKSREWFRALAERGSGTPAVPTDPCEAQRILNDIYSMRSWKLVQAYIRFMDHTRLGGLLRRVRDFFRGKRSKQT